MQSTVNDFVEDLHIKYILSLKKQKESFESCMTEHMRMSGIYWGLTSMSIMRKDNEMSKNEIIQWVMQCYHSNGGFSGNINHDPHLLYTCHAILILAICDGLHKIDYEKTSSYVASLQDKNTGAFAGDEWGELDTKFTYCAFSILSILKKMNLINKSLAIQYLKKCKNFDGGYGNIPGCESHGGHIFTVLAALSIGNGLNANDNLNHLHIKEEYDTLGWWLAERQCDSGGLNGRPEKQADVCYSWWNISSLIIIGKLNWINKNKLISFILNCQDRTDGGISDRPDNVADVYHTFFGIGGLSLLNYFNNENDINKMKEKFKNYRNLHPVYAIPNDVVKKLNLEDVQYLET